MARGICVFRFSLPAQIFGMICDIITSMNERPTNIHEESEYVHSLEEIRSVFEQLIGLEQYEDERRREDEQGIYLWEIKVPEENGYAEYSYERAGKYPECQASVTAVHVTFYDEDGIPNGGYAVVKFLEGEWKMIP